MDGIKCFARTSSVTHPLKSLLIDTGKGCRTMPFPKALLDHFTIELRDQTQYLQLQKLAFALGLNENTSTCYALVEKIQNSLRELTVRGVVDRCNSLESAWLVENFSLPQMSQLTRLDLWDCRINTLGFLFKLPNLKHLNLLFHGSVLTPPSTWNIIQTQGNDWRAAYLCFDWSAPDVMRLNAWFPNLEKLLIHATDASFPQICKGFPKLRRLFLFHGLVTNKVFAGIINRSRKCKRTDIFDRSPNITDLKELEYLALHRFALDNIHPSTFPPGRLSGFAVREGLMRMNKLNTLHLSHNVVCKTGMVILDESFLGKIIFSEEKLPSIMYFVA